MEYPLSDLPSRVEKLLESKSYPQASSTYEFGFADGVKDELRRLSSLHKALVECVTALDESWDHVEPCPELVALVKVVEEMENG